MKKSKRYEKKIEAQQKADLEAEKKRLFEIAEARIREVNKDEMAIREHMELVKRDLEEMDEATKARLLREKREREWRNSLEFKKFELQCERKFKKAEDEAKARAKAYREKKKQEKMNGEIKPAVVKKKNRKEDEQEEEKIQELRQQFFATMVNDFDKIKGYEKVNLRKDTRKKSKPKAS